MEWKTKKEWFSEIEDDDLRKRCFELCKESELNLPARNIGNAILSSFHWAITTEGHDYWSKISKTIDLNNMKKEPVIAAKPAKAPVAKVKTKRIGKIKASELINDSKGRIFTATFVKENGDERVMNCRKGVQKGVKGTGTKGTTPGMITVYDMQEKGFRTLNLQTVKALKINKESYKVN